VILRINSDSIKCEEFLVQLSDYQVLQRTLLHAIHTKTLRRALVRNIEKAVVVY
jgi:hypothetical protein